MLTTRFRGITSMTLRHIRGHTKTFTKVVSLNVDSLKLVSNPLMLTSRNLRRLSNLQLHPSTSRVTSLLLMLLLTALLLLDAAVALHLPS